MSETKERYQVEPRVSGVCYVNSDGKHIATFYRESDARRFVAGERAVEACRAAKPVIDAIVNAFPVHNDGDIIKAKNLIDSALSTLTTEGTK